MTLRKCPTHRSVELSQTANNVRPNRGWYCRQCVKFGTVITAPPLIHLPSHTYRNLHENLSIIPGGVNELYGPIVACTLDCGSYSMVNINLGST